VRMQNREVSFKILACSALRRAISSLFRELFYRADSASSIYMSATDLLIIEHARKN